MCTGHTQSRVSPPYIERALGARSVLSRVESAADRPLSRALTCFRYTRAHTNGIIRALVLRPTHVRTCTLVPEYIRTYLCTYIDNTNVDRLARERERERDGVRSCVAAYGRTRAREREREDEKEEEEEEEEERKREKEGSVCAYTRGDNAIPRHTQVYNTQASGQPRLVPPRHLASLTYDTIRASHKAGRQAGRQAGR